jgi:hypothetical protein
MRLILLVLCIALGACGDNIKPGEQPPPKDAAEPDAPDAPDNRVAPCLDRPNSLPQPGDQLPCELIPPSPAFQQR